MKLESQVVSLELSKRLKELGVKQGSLFTWVESIGANETYDDGTKNGEYKLTRFDGAVSNFHAMGFESKEHPMFSAFTVAELGEMLPHMIQKPPKTGDGKKWYVAPTNGFFETEADARAALLIYLLENKLIIL